MRIAIRVDSSACIGTGHVMRCLTLAERLVRRGAEVAFVCRPLPGHILGEIRRRGQRVVELAPPESTTWLGVTPERDAEQTRGALSALRSDALVVDHYALGAAWERAQREVVRRILVIDDLADRPHDCDVLLDQSYYRDADLRYRGLVPPGAVVLTGPRHALLRDAFYALRPRPRDGRIDRVLVSFGGVDAHGLTGRTLRALDALCPDPISSVTAVAGPASPHGADLERVWANRPWLDLHGRVDDMAARMHDADLAVGAGGVTTLERLHLGLPTVTVAVADNQRQTLHDLDEAGALWHLGWHEDVTAEALTARLRELLDRPKEVREVGLRGPDLMGERGDDPVVEALLA